MVLPMVWEPVVGFFFGTRIGFLKDPFLYLFKKNYEEADKTIPDEEKKQLKPKRMADYAKLILLGLGTMFWSVASSVLVDAQKKLSDLSPYDMNFFGVSLTLDPIVCYIIYFGLSLTIMICGLIAASFYNSSIMATGVAGLGAWKSLVFILITGHITSLKFHNEQTLCLNSMIASTSVMTTYWSYSAQDPRVLHIVVKALGLLICLVLWVLCFFVAVVGLCILLPIVWGLSAFGNVFFAAHHSTAKEARVRSRCLV